MLLAPWHGSEEQLPSPWCLGQGERCASTTKHSRCPFLVSQDPRPSPKNQCVSPVSGLLLPCHSNSSDPVCLKSAANHTERDSHLCACLLPRRLCPILLYFKAFWGFPDREAGPRADTLSWGCNVSQEEFLQLEISLGFIANSVDLIVSKELIPNSPCSSSA